jgi:hypothetical protein
LNYLAIEDFEAKPPQRLYFAFFNGQYSCTRARSQHECTSYPPNRMSYRIAESSWLVDRKYENSQQYDDRAPAYGAELSLIRAIGRYLVNRHDPASIKHEKKYGQNLRDMQLPVRNKNYGR